MTHESLSDFQLGLLLCGSVAFIAFGWLVIITTAVTVPL